ncbi:MAG: thioredoxin domain-containing protein [Pseudomonadota bacterium]
MTASSFSDAPKNCLPLETSPYLQQHADNPVHWWRWSDEAFAAAKAENKPVLLSVGYAACHWCHVMAHESFENDDIAALMNERFINIKVDREERPDLDHIYQAALAAMGQQGGWPLTMFLTPDRQPFWGGTYFPPEERFGRPGFNTVLTQVSDIYHAEPDKVETNVTALTEALEQQAFSLSGDAAIEPVVVDRMAERIAQDVDPVNGGIGGAPKFPHFSILELLWRAWLRTGDKTYYQAVTLTLDGLCEGGIYDHLGGGFARYATDDEWLVPHFEKMLYDNAQAIEVLTQVYLGSAKPLYKQRLFETVDWVLREMTVEFSGGDGGGMAFAGTLDADSEGEEGKFYVWTEHEVDALLNDKAPVFKAAYDVTGLGNWDGVNILNRRQGVAMLDADVEATLAECRDILFRARADRVAPDRDDKVLADWNGMMIAALARAGFVFERPDWVEAARRAYDFVVAQVQRDGVMRHSWCANKDGEGVTRGYATLDDFAQMARAAIILYQVQGDTALLQQAQRWVDHLDRHFWDNDNNGYYMVADQAADLFVRPRHAADQATPAGNGVMVRVLAMLFFITGEQSYLERFEACVTAFSGELQRNFFPLATFINSIDYFQHAHQVVIMGGREAAEAEGLIDALRRHPSLNLLLNIVDEDQGLSGGNPARHAMVSGKALIDDKPTAYICTGMACQKPVNSPGELAGLLAQQLKTPPPPSAADLAALSDDELDDDIDDQELDDLDADDSSHT